MISKIGLKLISTLFFLAKFISIALWSGYGIPLKIILEKKAFPKEGFIKIKAVQTLFYFFNYSLNASGWFMAKSAKTLRLSSISPFFNNPISLR